MNPTERLLDRLPEWTRSIRFRYTLLYSAVLFGLAAAAASHRVGQVGLVLDDKHPHGWIVTNRAIKQA